MSFRVLWRMLAVGGYLFLGWGLDSRAEVSVPNIFSDHMVLQRDQQNKVWGRANPGESVAVSIDGKSIATTADEDGSWQVMLEPLTAGGPHELAIKSDSNEIVIQDVLVGEVWICSGQSNMEWSISKVNDADLEMAAANYPKIRMINFPNIGSQETIWTHDKAPWMICSPNSVKWFSAVGYYFGRQLHHTLGEVPIGLVNNAWGGSAVDGWIDRRLLEDNADYQETLDRWKANESRYESLSQQAEHSKKEAKELENLKKEMKGRNRPGNIYQGVLHSHLGYGMKGVIWYQGETNAGRSYQYRDLFPMMIQNWRDQWQQGDFPFYWVQLADYMQEKPEPSESGWAELREAQTMTMDRLPNTGQAVIIDVGEGKDIHPRNKLTVGQRLARWALANEYGVDIAYHSPQFQSMDIKDGKAFLKFDHVHKGWRPFDVNTPVGFAIAGEDKKFVWADATILKDGRTIAVSSDDVSQPVAVRYAWADNPRCNMYDRVGLPLTPFRTDDWPGVTINNR